MNARKNEIVGLVEKIGLIMIAVVLFVEPLLILPFTTEPFSLPKQLLVASVVLIGLILLQTRIIAEGRVRLRRTPFDVPLLLIVIITFISAWLSSNRADALIAFVPLFLTILLYFLLVNFVRQRTWLTIFVVAFVAGAALTALNTIIRFFPAFKPLLTSPLLPLRFLPDTATFTPIGSLLEQAMYLAAVIPVAGYFASRVLKTKHLTKAHTIPGMITLAALFIGVGLFLTTYQVLTVEKPAILPLETGFQTAFAAISQDTNRIAQGFFFGSGFGTFATDFMRFKLPTFNNHADIWSLVFYKSSTFLLEILATTGVLGLAAWLFLFAAIVKSARKTDALRENPFFNGLIVVMLLAIVLPFFYTTHLVFFLLLGLYASWQAFHDKQQFFDVELHFVAFRKGMLGVSETRKDTETTRQVHSLSRILPVSLALCLIALVGLLGFNIVQYARADMIYQKSLQVTPQTKFIDQLNTQFTAIQTFPYRDGFYRVYSQQGLSFANALLASQPKDASPSAEVQKTVVGLVQQSINAARSATALSPLTVANWQNLASLYRGIFGFGQNAESFALASLAQAVRLDPTNPQEYIALGGLSMQLAQYDQAQQQFQVAIQLKPDLANAYYNLGHALEAKKQLQAALQQYENTKLLIKKDPEAIKKLNEEITKLKERIGTEANTAQQQQQPPLTQESTSKQPPLNISTPSAKLPPQKTPVKIPGPNTSITPTPSTGVSGTPTPTE